MSCGIQILRIPFEGEYIVQGDTIAKTSFEFLEGLDLTGCEIRLHLMHGNEVIIEFNETDGITIIDSTHFEIDELPYEENVLPIGTFEGDLEITDENGVRFTYARISYTIIKDLTI
jgi:hypothetical protein